MKPSQLESYFARMGMEVPKAATLDALRQIQEKHIYAIPVENLDIIHGKLPLSLKTDDLVDKVVVRRRGGLSFELNLLLADALKDLGYGVKLMSAKHPKYGNEFDHAFLLVSVPDDEGEWIVDVGYTESFRTPLLLDSRIWQSDGRDEYTFADRGKDEEGWKLLRRRGGKVTLMYSLNMRERQPYEYQEQCDWFCNNPNSRFTQGPFVFIERPEGRVCYSMDTVKNTFTGEQLRPVVQNRSDETALLREIFGIEMDEDLSDASARSGKFSYGRVFAAISNDANMPFVVDEAVRVALTRKALLRFGHIVCEADRDASFEGSFPAYVQHVREKVTEKVSKRLEQLGVINELLGGEVVVMGSNSQIGATIDASVDYAPEQLVESLIKPFNPDVVICGSSNKSKLRSFIQGSAGDYLTRKLDCEVIQVRN